MRTGSTANLLAECKVGNAHPGKARVLRTCRVLAYAGFVFGVDPKKVSPDKARAMMASINFNDGWARIHLARLCAAFVHADWSSTQEFVDAAGLPFWRMLTLLATKYGPPHCWGLLEWLCLQCIETFSSDNFQFCPDAELVLKARQSQKPFSLTRPHGGLMHPRSRRHFSS